MQISIIGGGSWGTALGHLLSGEDNNVSILVRNNLIAEEISLHHRNELYLPGLELNPRLKATCDGVTALRDAEICIFAVPVQKMATCLEKVAPLLSPSVIPVCVSKGIETTTLRRMQEVFQDILPLQSKQYAVFSGPSFAEEIVKNCPATVTLGCTDPSTAAVLQKVFSTENFRVYSCFDVIGVELGGAIKNVIAIAAGISDGMGLGNNARAGVITRGLAEAIRLGKAMGANEATFMGLSGMGDLILTSTSDQSRNRQVGLKLGQGKKLKDILEEAEFATEGVPTALAIKQLAKQYNVSMPIIDAMYRLMHDNVEVNRVVQELMSRALTHENH